MTSHTRTPFVAPDVTVFVDSSVTGAVDSLRRHSSQITTAVLAGLEVTEQGTLAGQLDPEAVQAARDFDVRAMLLLRLATLERGQQPEGIAEQVVGVCRSHRLSGVHIDLKDQGGWRGLVAIATELGRALHAAGLELIVDVPAHIDNEGLSTLARSADRIVVKTYGELEPTTSPGPVAEDASVDEALGAATRVLAPARLIAGLAIHGSEWSENAPPGPTSFVEAHAAAKEAQVLPQWDASGNARIEYADEKGPHTVWMADAATIWNQVRIAAEHRTASVALSRLGGEDPGVWDALGGADPDGLVTVPGDPRIEVEGEGPFVSLALSGEAGQRTFEMDGERVADERWSRLPSPHVLRRAGLERGLVALTFDGGPDSTFTPLILDLLKREQVPATFFVRGARALESPQLVRRAFAEGHELGNHGFTGDNIDDMGALRLQVELQTTSWLVESLVERRPLLYRPSSLAGIEPRTIDEARRFARVAAMGDIVVDADVDPRDWYASDPDALAEQTIEEVSQGGTVVLHDGGGDRSTTLQALPQIIARLRARGLQFVPLSRLIGKQRDDVMPASPSRATLGANLAQTAIRTGLRLAHLFRITLWITLSLMLLRTVLMSLAAFAAAKRRTRSVLTRPLPSVTAVVPIHNQQPEIGFTVDALLASDIPIDVVVVDDGSTDGTADWLFQRYRREPRVRVVRQARAGVATALRTGFTVCRTEAVVTLEPHTIVLRESVRRLIEPMRDSSVGAVAGTIENGHQTSALERWQAIDDLLRQEIGQRMWGALGAMPVVPRALGAWRRRAVHDAGGFASETMAPDADLTMRLCRRRWRVVHAASARARTSGAVTWATDESRRSHDQFGALQALWRHRRALLETSSGKLGSVVWPLTLLSRVVMPMLALAAGIGLALAALCGSLQPILPMLLVVLAAELAQLVLATELARTSGGFGPWTLARSWLSALLLYRPFLLLVAWRSIARAIEGAPIETRSPARDKTLLAYGAMRRALETRQ